MAALDRRGLSGLARHPGMAARRLGRRGARPARPCLFPPGVFGGDIESEDHRLLHRVPAAVHRPALPAGHQLLVMCTVAIAMAALTDCGWAVVAGAGRSFFPAARNMKWLGRLSGAVLIGGGIWLSLARRPG